MAEERSRRRAIIPGWALGHGGGGGTHMEQWETAHRVPSQTEQKAKLHLSIVYPQLEAKEVWQDGGGTALRVQNLGRLDALESATGPPLWVPLSKAGYFLHELDCHIWPPPDRPGTHGVELHRLCGTPGGPVFQFCSLL